MTRLVDRSTTWLIVVALGLGLLGTAVPAAAAPGSTAEAKVEVSEGEGAFSTPGRLTPESLADPTCSFIAWGAAGTPRVVVPSVVTVHGQDFAAASAACADLEGGSYTMFIRITFEYQPSPEEGWVGYFSTSCWTPSTDGVALISNCQASGSRPSFADDRPRRVRFDVGTIENGNEQVRASRVFGPLPPA